MKMSTLKVFLVPLLAFSMATLSLANTTYAQVSSVAPLDEASTTTSYNWSGYVATNGPYTSVTGSWILPSVAESSSLSADATWVGIGGIKSDDLIQAGTEAITNKSGVVTYQGWYEMLPQESQSIPLAIKSSDSISVAINKTGNNIWTISYKNNTTGQNYSVNVQYDSSLSSVEWVEEMPSTTTSFIPLDNFGTISFTNGSTIENGISKSISQSGPLAMNLVNRQGQALATVSSLGNDGQSFTVTRTLASSADAIGGRRSRRGWTKVTIPQDQSVRIIITTYSLRQRSFQSRWR